MEYRAADRADRASFFDAIVAQLGADADGALRSLGLSVEEFRALYSTTGEVRAVLAGGHPVGHLWIEHRERTLHIHGFILRPASRGRGFGTRIVDDLRAEFAVRADSIEIGVQMRNADAIRFYERVGFRTAPTPTADGFQIMQLSLRREDPGSTN